MAFFPLLSIRCLYSGNWYNKYNLSYFIFMLLGSRPMDIYLDVYSWKERE
ncbi:hypothetical protein [Wolbachia endosymbiont (group B) of Gerris lacustris]